MQLSLQLLELQPASTELTSFEHRRNVYLLFSYVRQLIQFQTTLFCDPDPPVVKLQVMNQSSAANSRYLDTK